MANRTVKEFEFSPQFGYTGSAGKTQVKAYMRGGKAEAPKPCACGGKAMKKGGSSKLSKSEKKMAKGLLNQMAQQAAVTGRVPGVPQAPLAAQAQAPLARRGMAAPNARAVPVASQEPLVGLKKGGAKQAKVTKVMGEFGKGELHSGSKSGPVVKNRKQAVAIALSEARNRG